MSPDQPRPVRTRRTLRRRSRTPRSPLATESEAEASPLEDLRKRCVLAACVTGIGYLAVLATTAVRPTALNDAATVGLLIALGSMAGLCALGAILTWAVAQMPEPPLDRQAETIEWAIRLGEDLADAYREAPSGSSRGR